MTLKLLLVIFLMAFVAIAASQNEPPIFESFSFYSDEVKPRIEMQEIKATFNGEQVFKVSQDSMSSEESKDATSEELFEIDSSEEQMKTNKVKREADRGYVSLNIQSNKEYQDPKPQAAESLKEADKIKRQTSITGNGNRLSNLINLPVRLNVLANALSQLNQGVIDVKEKPLSSNTIVGNDNRVSGLVNAPIDVDAVVNILSKVDRTKPGSADDGNKGGVVGDLLGALLGGRDGGPEKENKGLVGGLLEGVLGDGKDSGLLGNTLGELLGALVGSDGLVGKLLGGVNGKNLVTELVHNLLGGVAELVDNLLELLVGVLEGLLHGLKTGASSAVKASFNSTESSDNAAASPALSIQGHNNNVSFLINAPLRVKALISALTSLRQEIRQHMDPAVAVKEGVNIQGNSNEVSSLINLPANVDLNVNLLSSIAEDPLKKSSGEALQTLLPAPPPPKSSTMTASLKDPAGTSIEGNNNVLSSLLNVVPEVNLNLNLLNEITDLLDVKNDTKAGDSDKPESIAAQEESNPNEICFDIPISQPDTSVVGDNNKISNAINVKPKIKIDLNLLSSLKETSDSKVPTQRVCIIRPTQPLTSFTPAPNNQAALMPAPANPVPAPPLLSSIASSQKPVPPRPETATLFQPIPRPHKPVAPIKPTELNVSAFPMQAHPSPATPISMPIVTSSPSEICFDVLVDPSGHVVSGNNNHISSLISLEPQINLDLNVLSNASPTNSASNLMVKRICLPPKSTIPIEVAATPTHQQFQAPADPRCFRRTCTRWRQFLDYNCLDRQKEYPKITYTRDI